MSFHPQTLKDSGKPAVNTGLETLIPTTHSLDTHHQRSRRGLQSEERMMMLISFEEQYVCVGVCVCVCVRVPVRVCVCKGICPCVLICPNVSLCVLGGSTHTHIQFAGVFVYLITPAI